MPVEFRYATFGDYRRISKFLDEYWAKDHVYVRMPELFEWTFARRNLWDRDGYSFALAEDKDEVVGILGGIPVVFNCLGRLSRGAWLGNYMVRPDYRGGTVAVRLLSMFSSDQELIATSGLNPAVSPFLQALRWRVLGNFPRHFCVLPHAVGRMSNVLRLTYPDWQADRCHALARFLGLRDLPRTTLQAENTLPPSWDRYDWPEIASRTIGAGRDLAYLNWRYTEHPCFDYRFLAVPEGQRTGLAVWRLETIRMATDRGFEEVDSIGRLVEFLPVSRDNSKQLLSVFLQELQKADVLGADYYGYYGETRTWLRECGLREVEAHPDGQAIPTRFQPLDGKSGTILNALCARNQVPICSVGSNCLWYWTKSDGDQDRPN